jgi:hypothetical protein
MPLALLLEPPLAYWWARARTLAERPRISSDGIEDKAPEDAVVLASDPREGIELEPLNVEPEAEGPTGTLANEDEDPELVEAAIGAETLLG